MNPRGTAFASDFDGTLCISDWDKGTQEFDPNVIDAVRAYQAAGGLFGVCTGRPLFSVIEALEGLLTLDFYIVTTGAQVMDRDLSPLLECPIDRTVAQQLYDRYASDDMGFVAVNERTFFSVGRPFAEQMPMVPTLDAVEGTLLGVSLESHGDEELAHNTCAELNRLFGDKVEGFQNLGSVDIVPRGCSKGSGVRVAREALGVSCMAGAGDSYNDLPLLGAADVSYTFHSSPQQVRDAATHVVSDLAEALHHFMA